MDDLYQEPMDEGDTSRFMPQQGAIPDESEGLDTSARPDPNATPTSGLLKDAENTPPVQGIRKLVSYLMGQGSIPPQEAQRIVHEVKQANPGLSDDDANLLAVHQASEMGGPGAAWGMVQYNRSAYNAKQSFAKAALNGIDGKAGDISAAAQAATQAGSHVLDGSTAVFSAGPEGITATVTDPDTRARQQYRLTPQQFNDYLDVGKVGQWDKVMDGGGIGGTLKKVAMSGGAGAAAPAQAPQDQGQGKEASNFGTTPSTLDLSGGAPKGDLRGYKPLDYSAIDDPNASLVARANQLFPSVSQQDQRAAWISAQEDKEAERENKLGIASAGNSAKERIAAIQGGARTQSAQTRATGEVTKQGIRTEGNKDVARIQADARGKSDQAKALAAAEKMERTSSDAKLRERGRMARAEIGNPNFLLQKQEDRDAILKKWGLNTPTGEAAPPPTGQPGARPQGIPAGAKQWNGQWYTRGQNGEAVLVPGQ